MISADFAPNESFSDVLSSFSIMLRPWQWRKGKALSSVKQRLKKLFGVTYDVSLFLTGRAALYRLFQALELEKGTQVAVQAFTCEAVVLPLLELKVKPLYIDIERETYSMSVNDLEKKLTPETKVLILQHTFGMRPLNREKILKTAAEKGLIVIEDLAHGFNNQLFKKPNMEPQSQFLLLSFGRTKTLSSVFGGAILSTDRKVSEKLRDLEKVNNFPSSGFIASALWYKPLGWFFKKTYDVGIGKVLHFITNSLQVLPREISGAEKRGEFDLQYIKAYPNALARLLLNQFKQIDQIYRKRSVSVNKYKMYFYKKPPHTGELPLIRFPLFFTNPETVVAAAKKKNIYLGRWYDQVIAPKELPLNKLHYIPGSCPIAESICKGIVNLPTTITEEEAEKILDIVAVEVN